MSYACKRIIIITANNYTMNMKIWIKWQISVLGKMHLLVCSIRVLAKNHGNPYYGPTIVVHDILKLLKSLSKNSRFPTISNNL